MQQTHSKMMTTKELARHLNISHRTLENMRQLGKGPKYYKLGRMVRYDLSEARAWVKRPEAS